MTEGMPAISFGGRALPLAGYSKFRRLAITHALMMAGDAAMVVALADSLFFSIDPDAARERVLLFLVLGFAPFLVLAPLIGPALDRIAGGRRAAILAVATCRVGLCLLMVAVIDNLALFPVVFASLVLQKTYVVCKSALVPSVVRSERDLVEANSKLGLISGMVGFAAVIPATILQLTPVASQGTLVYAALLFSAGLIAATFLSADVVARDEAGPVEEIQLHSPSVQNGAIVMTLIRGAVGFVMFLIAFSLKAEGASTAWFGVALGLAALGTIVGNASAPRIRQHASEEKMLIGALIFSTAAAAVATIVGGTVALVGLAFAVNLAGSIARLGFESTLQRDAPQANRGRAIATFETRFQLSWAIAAMIPVMVTISDRAGALVVFVACGGGLAYLLRRPRRKQQPADVTP
ncbi:MAG TPA: MFS transporter [Desertimonas sp.]|nr:MFS transporter [Desertimonas sp.]